MIGVFLDIEASGLDPVRHAALEIAFRLVDLSSGEIGEGASFVIQIPLKAWEQADPLSLKVNGFTWEMVQEGIPLQKVSQEIIAFFNRHHLRRGSAVFICQNPAFDRAFFAQIVSLEEQEQLHWPYHWLDLASMYWGLTVKEYMAMGRAIPEAFPLSKNDIARHFGLPAEQSPHRAKNGVDHLISCYQAVVGLPHLSSR